MAEEPLLQTPALLRFGVETGERDEGLLAFAPVRPRLFGIAYRMLGSAAEAEDVVQDVWLRWQSTNRSVVQDPETKQARWDLKVRPKIERGLRARTGSCLTRRLDHISCPLTHTLKAPRNPFPSLIPVGR